MNILRRTVDFFLVSFSAYMFFFVIVILKPLVIIRIGKIISSRLGHFSGNTELYCCERDVNINTPSSRYIDVFFLENYVCNKQLEKMWRRELNIAPAFLRKTCIRLYGLIKNNNLTNHQVPNNTRDNIDINLLLRSVDIHVNFTANEKKKGEKLLREMGVPVDAKIVCIYVRDDSYLKKVKKNKDFSYHDYRDCDIGNFHLVANKLADLGYYVFRMGFHVKKRFNSQHPRVVDYAANGMRSDFSDIYLSSVCEFIISTATGADAVATWCFRKPVVLVNLCPVGYMYSFSEDIIVLTKHHFLENEDRELTLSEIFSSGLGFCLRSSCYSDRGIKLVENTDKEILDVTMEMVARTNGNNIELSLDSELQKKFLAIFTFYVFDKDISGAFSSKGISLHGNNILSRLGARFLRENTWWLEIK